MKKLFYKIKPFGIKSKNIMEVEVTLEDRKMLMGRKLCKIIPVSGKGFIWVNEKTLIIK